MNNLLTTSKIFSIGLLALLFVLPACSHRKIVQIGSHTVTVSRHGFEKKLSFTVKDQGSEPTLEYAGVSTDGKGLKVYMRGDEIRVNGVKGKLKPGDKVLISDHGVAVNNLDYGQSEKYLQANNSDADSAALN